MNAPNDCSGPVRRPGRRSRQTAFTLIELLVITAIIAILAAILFPVFAQAKAAAKSSVNRSNAKQVGLAHLMYSGDYDDCYVFWGRWDVPDTDSLGWGGCYPAFASDELFMFVRNAIDQIKAAKADRASIYAAILHFSSKIIRLLQIKPTRLFTHKYQLEALNA